MTKNKNDTSPIVSYYDYILDNSKSIDFNNTSINTTSISNTMYYTNNTGTLDTITINVDGNVDDQWKFSDGWMIKEFENTMPDLTKVKDMCTMYPALDKAFENFKAIYDLIKDDYETRKNRDT